MKTCPTSLSNAKALKCPYCKPLGLKRKQNREQSSEILPGLSPQDQRWLQDPGSPQLCGALKRHRTAWILPDLLQSLTWICLAETESLYLQMAKPQPSLGFAGKQTSLPGVWKAESSNYNDWLLTQIEVSLAHSLPVGMERTLNQKASLGPQKGPVWPRNFGIPCSTDIFKCAMQQP